MSRRVRLEPMTEQRYLSWIPETIAGFVRQRTDSGTQSEREARAEAELGFDRLLPDGLHTAGHHLWSVFDVESPDEVGYLWLAVPEQAQGDEAFVYDVAVASIARGRGLGRATMLAAEEEARRRGATAIKLNVFAHNRVARALYDSLGYQPVATQMARRLDRQPPMPVPDGPLVRLLPMTGDAFERYRARAEEKYADSIASSGDQHFWTACDGDREVGTIWLQIVKRPDGPHAFGYHFVVAEPLRRHGYGRMIMALVEAECRDRGVSKVGLNVFGADTGAHRFYEQMGFEATSTLMTKPLR